MAGYVSPIPSGTLIIDDLNFALHIQDPVINGEKKLRGLIPRDWIKQPYGSLSYASPFPDSMLIPRDEWDDRIKELEETKTQLTDLCDQAGLTVLDQDGTNYCWINAPTHCVEVVRTTAGQQLVRLSPASVGGPIKNYRNVGGWGTEGLEYLVKNGSVPQSMWPPNAISRQYDTAETRAVRAQYKVLEFNDLRPRNFDQAASCYLQRIPVALGLNWWSHEVTGMNLKALKNDPAPVAAALHAMAKADPKQFATHSMSDIDRLAELMAAYGTEIDNSWGLGWGTRGRGILTGTKQLGDDQVIARVATPS